jgi:hypothetical protein
LLALRTKGIVKFYDSDYGPDAGTSSSREKGAALATEQPPHTQSALSEGVKRLLELLSAVFVGGKAELVFKRTHV